MTEKEEVYDKYKTFDDPVEGWWYKVKHMKETSRIKAWVRDPASERVAGICWRSAHCSAERAVWVYLAP